jgi:hypothetical protein
LSPVRQCALWNTIITGIHSLLLARQSLGCFCFSAFCVAQGIDDPTPRKLRSRSRPFSRNSAGFLQQPAKQGGMFQPQATPYSAFASYGGVPDFHSFQPSQTTRQTDSGGPTFFRDPIFSPVNTNANANASTNASGAPTYNNLDPHFKMSTNNINDLEQQEELARSFQPDLQVCSSSRK